MLSHRCWTVELEQLSFAKLLVPVADDRPKAREEPDCWSQPAPGSSVIRECETRFRFSVTRCFESFADKLSEQDLAGTPEGRLGALLAFEVS